MQGPTAAAVEAVKKKPHLPGDEQQEKHLKCPRCDSINTKFCYYNNYNLSQPRHFCKNCRRYWTRGGALRNIPVGGGTRKNSKRSTAIPSFSSSSHPRRTSDPPPPPPDRTPSITEHQPPTPAADGDQQLLDFGGSFGSLLGSSGSFEGSLVDNFHLVPGLPNWCDGSYTAMEGSSVGSGGSVSDVDPPVLNLSMGLHGDGIFWNGGDVWPDLSIYTPGSSSALQ